MSEQPAITTFGAALKIPGGGEAERCFYNLRFDSYGCGCSHNCHYCDYEAFRPLWANQNDCCNALGKVAGFRRTAQ